MTIVGKMKFTIGKIWSGHLWYTRFWVQPPPPLLKRSPGNPPPSPGDCHFTVLLSNICCSGLCRPSVTHVLALLSHHFKSVTHVISVIFYLQRLCAGCHVAFSDPGWFLLATVYGTTLGALVLATVVGPSPNGAQFCLVPVMQSLNMCNSSKCAILIPRSSLLLLWIPNNICVA